MRFLIVALAALLPGTAAAAEDEPNVIVPKPLARVVSPAPAHCPGVAGHVAARPDQPLRPRTLTDLPPAEAIHAMYRLGPDGCPDPLPVGYQYRRQR